MPRASRRVRTSPMRLRFDELEIARSIGSRAVTIAHGSSLKLADEHHHLRRPASSCATGAKPRKLAIPRWEALLPAPSPMLSIAPISSRAGASPSSEAASSGWRSAAKRPPARLHGDRDRGGAADPDARRAGGDHRDRRLPPPERGRDNPDRHGMPAGEAGCRRGVFLPTAARSSPTASSPGSAPCRRRRSPRRRELAIDNGVTVDAHLRTEDEDIFAAGDCCSFPHPLYMAGGASPRSLAERAGPGRLRYGGDDGRGGRICRGALVLVRPVRPQSPGRWPRRRGAGGW